MVTRDTLSVKNTAIRQLGHLKGYAAQTGVPGKDTVEEVAIGSQIENDQDWDWKKFVNGTTEKRTYWIAGGISLLLIVLFIVAVKYKLIKL